MKEYLRNNPNEIEKICRYIYNKNVRFDNKETDEYKKIKSQM